MGDELIRLDTTIIGIDSLINKAPTAKEAKVLFTAKDVIYSQQRFVMDVQPVKHGEWKHVAGMNSKCSVCSHYFPVSEFDSRPFDINFCPNCGARMDRGADDENS